MANKSNQSQNVVFRKKATSFSMIANPIIDDRNISPAAGWLYVTIQRWITFNAEDFVCSKAFIASKYQSGYRMFNRAWDELKDNGYLKMYSHPIDGWQAELLDDPQPDTPHTYYLDKSGVVNSTNVDRAEKKAAKESQTMAEDHYPQNDTNGTHYPQNDSNANDSNANGGNIINTLNNNFNKSAFSINPSKQKKESIISAKEMVMDRLIDDSLIQSIKDQVEYDWLIANTKIDEEDLNAAVEVIAALKTVTEPQEFSGSKYSPEYVRARADQINQFHIEYVFECFYGNSTKVKNISSYLKTTIFNAPTTHSAYTRNEVNADIMGR